MSTKTAVVVGALGVIGRYIVDKLASLPDWQVIGLSRRRFTLNAQRRTRTTVHATLTTVLVRARRISSRCR